MKRRRVDLSLRVQEARDVEEALGEWLTWATLDSDDGESQMMARVRRVVGRLRRGIAYVLDTYTPPRSGR